MSQVSFEISPNNGKPKGRDESLPPLAKKPPLREGAIHVQVIPPQGEIVWTTGQFIQPR